MKEKGSGVGVEKRGWRDAVVARQMSVLAVAPLHRCGIRHNSRPIFATATHLDSLATTHNPQLKNDFKAGCDFRLGTCACEAAVVNIEVVRGIGERVVTKWREGQPKHT
jgi:hypothetical protein